MLDLSPIGPVRACPQPPIPASTPVMQCGQAFVLGPDDAGRAPVEALIETVYARRYGARLKGHYPHLLYLTDAAGLPTAAIGFRYASEDRLFLESYLDSPVESGLAQALAIACIERSGVVELGSLASTGLRQACQLYGLLAAHLARSGLHFAVATLTGRLERVFSAAGLPMVELGRADATRLADHGENWGRYYDERPRVVAGSIAEWAHMLGAVQTAGGRA